MNLENILSFSRHGRVYPKWAQKYIKIHTSKWPQGEGYRPYIFLLFLIVWVRPRISVQNVKKKYWTSHKKERNASKNEPKNILKWHAAKKHIPYNFFRSMIIRISTIKFAKKIYEKTVFKKKKNISNKEQKAPQNPPNDHPPFTIVVQKYTKVKKFFFIIKHTLEPLMPQRVHSLIFPFFPVQTRLHSFTFTQCNYYNCKYFFNWRKNS